MQTKPLLMLLVGSAMCLTGVVCSSAEEAAQPAPLSLQDCVNLALKNQTDIQVAQNNIEIAKARSTQARSNYFPQVSLQNNTFQLGSKGVLSEINTGTALTATQNIWDGGMREYQAQGARYGITENSASMTRTVQTVTYGVTQSYYEVLRAKHLADVASSSVKYNEGLRDLIKARIEAGDAAEVDVLPVEAQLATAHVNLLTAQNNVRTATVQLQNDMGLSPQPGFDVQEAGAVPEPEIRPMDAYVSTALASRPDIQGSKAGLGAANASVKSARLSVYPRPIISGQYELGLAGLSGSSTQIVGGISLDLFNGSRTRAALKEAQASKANAEQRSTQVTKDVQSQVQQAYLNLTSSKERLAASNVGLNAAQKNYDVQSARYKQGLAIPLDLLNAELQVVTAQSNAVQARYDYYISLAQMDFAVGRQGGFNAG